MSAVPRREPDASPARHDASWRALHERATAPYRAAGNFAWHFARGKLGRDPAFRGIVERGLIGAGRARVLDIGCGQGLFASLLDAMAAMQREPGRWPSDWPATPAVPAYTGIELMPRDVARAEHSLAALVPTPRFVCGDMVSAALPASDLVVILDVLHYVDHAAQEAVLTRVRDALDPAQGRLLLRVGDAASRRGFAISQWVDRTVTRVRGHKVSPTWGRPLPEWIALLERLGFGEVRSLPMSEGTPFANVLLIADRVGASAADALAGAATGAGNAVAGTATVPASAAAAAVAGAGAATAPAEAVARTATVLADAVARTATVPADADLSATAAAPAEAAVSATDTPASAAASSP